MGLMFDGCCLDSGSFTKGGTPSLEVSPVSPKELELGLLFNSLPDKGQVQEDACRG